MTTKLDAIEARAAAATPGPWFTDGWGKVGHDGAGIGEMDSAADGEMVAHARTDIPALLAVARAARLVKAQCDDMCPSWYDEPCDCGMAALRATLAPLLEPEP